MAIRERTWTHNGIEKSAWQVDYIDQSGKRLRKQFDRKKDADAFLLTARTEVRNGTHTSDSNSVTVAVAAQQWLDNNGGEAPWERTTHVAYSQHVKLHIVPALGGVKLSQLTVPAIAQFERTLRAGGCSLVMVKKARTSLGSILSLAMDNGLVAQNVVRARGKAKASKRVLGGKLKVGIDIPSTDDIRTLLPQLQGYLRPLILTAAFAGLRWSELRGLTWANVDLRAGTLAVTQRMDRFGDMGAPKSEAGERTVPLLPMIVNVLRELKLASPSNELVFINSRNQPLQRNTVIERFHAAQIAAFGAVKYKGLHSLRHFFASWCLARVADGGRGLPVQSVQALMGHSSITMTVDVYGHLFPAQNDTAELHAAETAFLAG